LGFIPILFGVYSGFDWGGELEEGKINGIFLVLGVDRGKGEGYYRVFLGRGWGGDTKRLVFY
jgi:hypothetical protein